MIPDVRRFGACRFTSTRHRAERQYTGPLMSHSIPLVDISSLFGEPSRERTRTDRAIMAAAATPGFMVGRGLPPDVPAGRAVRADLLRLFQLPEQETRKLWRQKFESAYSNVYRGWFPLQKGFLT